MATSANVKTVQFDTQTPEEQEPTGQNGGKNTQYVNELLKEKMLLNADTFSNAIRLIDEEVSKALTGGKQFKGNQYVDLCRLRPMRVAVKVRVPVTEHPWFNFVGKLLGPQGNTLKRLQEETMTKMSIMGRGSMRDKGKEEQCRNSLDPKYAHLCDDLHVEIVAFAPAPEAYARIALALTEIKKYLVANSNDEIRQEQLKELQAAGREVVRPNRIPPPGLARGVTRGPPLLPVPPHADRTKAKSILDKARMSLADTQDEPVPPYYNCPEFNNFGGTNENYQYGPPRVIGKLMHPAAGVPNPGVRPSPYFRPAK